VARPFLDGYPRLGFLDFFSVASRQTGVAFIRLYIPVTQSIHQLFSDKDIILFVFNFYNNQYNNTHPTTLRRRSQSCGPRTRTQPAGPSSSEPTSPWPWVTTNPLTAAMSGTGELCKMSFLNHVTIFMRQFEDICHHSMHSYVNGVSKYIYNGSNVLFLGVLSNRIVTVSVNLAYR